MIDKKQETGGEDRMIQTAIRMRAVDLEEAREKAKQEGRPLAAVLRKLVLNWLTGKYKPFDD